jgi:predicted nucleotidyltransferase
VTHAVEYTPVPDFEGTLEVDEATFLRVLDDATDTLEEQGIPYALLGGVASTALGRRRWTHDIDIFVSPEDADRSLQALEAAGFLIQRKNPHWLYKAMKEDVLVDVIFRARGDITLDDAMLERAHDQEFRGQQVRVLAPEDLIVIKVASNDVENPRHWYDALGMLRACDIDWEYLVERARVSPRRVLSLLLYAQSEDYLVPGWVVRSLFDTVCAPDGGTEESGESA